VRTQEVKNLVAAFEEFIEEPLENHLHACIDQLLIHDQLVHPLVKVCMIVL